jgi:hypothetical protein
MVLRHIETRWLLLQPLERFKVANQLRDCRRSSLAPASWCARAGVGRASLPGGTNSGRSDLRTKLASAGRKFETTITLCEFRIFFVKNIIKGIIEAKMVWGEQIGATSFGFDPVLLDPKKLIIIYIII